MGNMYIINVIRIDSDAFHALTVIILLYLGKYFSRSSFRFLREPETHISLISYTVKLEHRLYTYFQKHIFKQNKLSKH